MAEGAIVQELAFHMLLYRYFFFGWLFKNTSRGNLFERSAIWRFSRTHTHWLLACMRRWLWYGLPCCTLGGVLEPGLNTSGLSVLFYVPSALNVPVNVIIGVLWVGLKALPGSLREWQTLTNLDRRQQQFSCVVRQVQAIGPTGEIAFYQYVSRNMLSTAKTAFAG